MTETAVALDANLAFYANHGAALFPIPAGSKNPGGLVPSFKHDFSRDPAAWQTWRSAHPSCNFGVVAFASYWITIDIDTSGPEGRAEAWALWSELCASWGIPTAAPHIESARGGWHVYFALPPHIDPSQLRQPDAIKKRINVRCIGYTVAAGSHFEGRPYTLFPNAPPPHPAPDTLIRHCTRAAPRLTSASPQGSRDVGDVASLLRWLAEHDAFSSYEDWYQIGMALRVEFGDSGEALWDLCHDGTVSPDTAASKWQSFATDPTPDSITLDSFLKRAHAAGWRGSIRKSASSMFDGVAQIAAAAGASLHSGAPLPPAGQPMLAGQAELARLAAPILAEFITATADAPTAPATQDFPTLPPACNGHDLYEPMQGALVRICALAEPGQKLKPSRITDALAVLAVMHPDVFESTCRRLRAWGHALQDRRIRLSAANLSEAIERVTVTLDKWEYDSKGEIQSDNSDNVQVLLGVLGLSVRWNAWLERMEIQGGGSELFYPRWTYIDDSVVAKLRTRANRTKTRFRPGKEFFWESLLSIAQASPVDPCLELLATLQASWDGTPRLSDWLSRSCVTAPDAYHQAVARNIIGGMVRRARHPGCKHDTMAVFYGFQGSGKSTMAAIIADMGQSSLPSILLGNGAHFTDTVLLGDQSKELVLSLAGKLVAEIGEMGMRGSANPNHVKAMISRQVDAGRTAYARAVTERQRRNIFIGTANDDEPLVDPTGNRRFLPVRVESEVNLAWLHANVAQIVGEAAALEAAGDDFAIPRDVWALAKEHQEAARAESDVETLLTDWFAPTAHTETAFITAADLVYLSQQVGWKGGNAGRGVTMRALGFRSENVRVMGKRTKIWMRAALTMHNATGAVCGAVRYIVGADSHGRPIVSIRGENPLPDIPMPPCPC